MSDAAYSPGSPQPPDPAGGNLVVASPSPAADPSGKTNGLIPLKPDPPCDYLSNKLDDAELLLGYAAEVGIEVPKKVSEDVLQARVESVDKHMSKETASNLLMALATLAAVVRPVTVQSLKFCLESCKERKQTKKTMRYCMMISLLCAMLIL